MLRSAFTYTALVRNAATAASATVSALHDSAASLLSSSAAAAAVHTTADHGTSALESSFLQDMLSQYASGRHVRDDAETEAETRSATTTTTSTMSQPPPSSSRRRVGTTVMSKARRIRLAAAAQEAAEHLQEAGSPAAAMIHSQHVDQLREEERLLEVSLQRLRAERDLAVSRHDCERDLQRFRRGMRDREDAVAVMVKSKYENLRNTPGGAPEEAVASVLADSRSGTAGDMGSARPEALAATTPQLVYRQGALDVRGGGEDGTRHLAAGDALDVEEAMTVRFLMDMDATADADDALEAAAAAASSVSATAASKRTRASSRQVVKKAASASGKRRPRATAPAPVKKDDKKTKKPAKKPEVKKPAKKPTKKPTTKPTKKPAKKPTVKKPAAPPKKNKSVKKSLPVKKSRAKTSPARRGRK